MNRESGFGMVQRVTAVCLVTIGILGAVLFLRATADAGSKAVTPAALAAPVLSARRVPRALQLGVGRQRLGAVVSQQLANPALESAREKSCLVVSAAGGLVVAEAADRAVIPASTQKILTATSVLSRLDPGTRFRTEVRATRAPAGGTLTGDLWLVGGGDPLLETADYTTTQIHDATDATPFETLVDGITKAGVTTVTGSIVGDGRRFDGELRIPSWKRSYTSTGEVGVISGLMVNDNFSVTNQRGTRTASDNPPADAAALLRKLLTEHGVVVLGEPRAADAEDPTAERAAPVVVASVESNPIAGVVGEMLRWSDNTTAEMLIKEIGRADGILKAPGSWSLGISRVEKSLALSGVTLGNVQIIDGSGLDVSNRVTCRVLLETVQSHPTTSAFFAGLPLMGQTGTLRKRLRDSPAAGHVRAKTGTLNGVSSLVGAADTTDASTVHFAIVFNGLRSTADGVAAADSVVEALVNFPDAPPVEQFAEGLPADSR